MPPKHLADCGKIPAEGGMPRCAVGCPVHAARQQRREGEVSGVQTAVQVRPIPREEPADDHDGNEKIDREALTPRQSGSFAAFYTVSVDTARDLRQAVQSAADRIELAGCIMGDMQRMRCALAWEMALELDKLALRFAKWPEARPGPEAEAVAVERPVLTSKLIDMARKALELMGEIKRG